MKKSLALLAVCSLMLLSSGCVATKQNSYDINQLKNQMANVESVLARQNLLIQQNKGEIDALYDRYDDVAVSVANIKDSRRGTTQTPRRTTSAVQRAQKPSEVISDKLIPPPSISQVQTALRNAGFYIGKIDGKAGPMTHEAIISFQKANNLVSDGIVGPQTWKKLKDYL